MKIAELKDLEKIIQIYSKCKIELDNQGILYLLEYKNEIIGTINISKEQGNGFARKLMDFAEDYAEKKGYTSIRLDAFSQNERVIKFF